jgi:lipopolysaccharide transport system ATP-binding protein
MISIKNISKCYQIYDKPQDRLKQALWRGRRQYFREFWAIKDLSCTIKENETIGIIGSNGSGKSTLLQLICGIVTPSEGNIDVLGRIAGLLELGAGFNPEFTGRENIRIKAAILGLSETEIDTRIEDIVEFADIGEFIERPVKTYSSGMYVRLGFAVAISVNPDILVVDEALAVGDARFRQKCMARIKDFCHNGTVIIVSHDMSAITGLCTRALWIEAGHLRMDSSPKRVVEKYLEFIYNGQAIPGNDDDRAASRTVDLKTEGYIPIDGEVRQFGNQSVSIQAVRLHSDGVTNSVAYAGKSCEIDILFKSNADLDQPICGYIIKDGMGRILLADNSVLLSKKLPALKAGHRYLIRFAIDQWPNILAGQYTLSVAVAEGSMDDFKQCHWLHDALVFENIPVRKPGGILSIINTDISIEEAGV